MTGEQPKGPSRRTAQPHGQGMENEQPVEHAAESSPQDRELAAAAAGGDRRASRLLAERLMPRVRTLVRYLVADDRDADDLVQLALIEILRSLRNFRGESRLEAWADRIAVRTAMRELKRRRWREGIVALDDPRPPEVASTQDSDLERRQLRRHLGELLGRLPPEQRVVVVLRLVHGYPPAEIAEVVGAPLNTVRDRLRVGRRKLRRLLVRDPILREWAERSR